MNRLCIDCGAHERVADSNRCRECLLGLLRRTRLAQPAWVKAARENRLPARDMTGQAA